MKTTDSSKRSVSRKDIFSAVFIIVYLFIMVYFLHNGPKFVGQVLIFIAIISIIIMFVIIPKSIKEEIYIKLSRKSKTQEK